MSEITVLQGEVFKDHRGRISSLNNFRFDGVNRVYFINHPDTSVVRGWHGHKHEKKWFYCVKGEFKLGLVKPDDWENPSIDLKPEVFVLNEDDSKVVCVPEGYANCLIATIPDSVMLVFSGKILEDALTDSWRYSNDMWKF